MLKNPARDIGLHDAQGREGFRGRFGRYVPPLMEALGLAELEHNPRNNRMRVLREVRSTSDVVDLEGDGVLDAHGLAPTAEDHSEQVLR